MLLESNHQTGAAPSGPALLTREAPILSLPVKEPALLTFTDKEAHPAIPALSRGGVRVGVNAKVDLKQR